MYAKNSQFFDLKHSDTQLFGGESEMDISECLKCSSQFSICFFEIWHMDCLWGVLLGKYITSFQLGLDF